MSWSGGKDSCVALAELLKDERYEVRALLTTVTRDHDQISMHGVSRTLLQQQAAALGLDLQEVFIPKAAANADYESALEAALVQAGAEGTATVAFGDLYLQDIRAYREAFLRRIGVSALFPVWGRDTDRFIRDFVEAGYKAVVACVDGAQLSPEFAGRMIDAQFIADLPAGIDPCGENGEFHTFVFDGPIFSRSVGFTLGKPEQRGAFWFSPLLPL